MNSVADTPVEEAINRPRVSGFVITYNEESNIRGCLESLSFCDELLVVDSHSTDRTKEIAEQLGARVISRDWPGYLAQKQFASEQCSYDWVLYLDADERITPELRDSILQGLTTCEAEGLAGFEFNRINFFLERWWRRGGWYPEYRLRLFRKSRAFWEGADVHEKVVAKGQVSRLSGEIEHFSFKDLEDQLRRLMKYARLSVREILETEGKIGFVHLVLNPINRFLKFYLFKQGFREGYAGLIVAVNEAFYTFLKYALAWEEQLKNKRREQ
jgi:glycosyltransferase involved in cell wall biosynthesis